MAWVLAAWIPQLRAELAQIAPGRDTAGSVTLQHAQSSSNAAATTVRARSWAACYLVS